MQAQAAIETRVTAMTAPLTAALGQVWNQHSIPEMKLGLMQNIHPSGPPSPPSNGPSSLPPRSEPCDSASHALNVAHVELHADQPLSW